MIGGSARVGSLVDANLLTATLTTLNPNLTLMLTPNIFATVTLFPPPQAGDELDDAAAADMAEYVAAVRGAGALGTSAAECRAPSPAFLADVWQVCSSGAT